MTKKNEKITILEEQLLMKNGNTSGEKGDNKGRNAHLPKNKKEENRNKVEKEQTDKTEKREHTKGENKKEHKNTDIERKNSKYDDLDPYLEPWSDSEDEFDETDTEIVQEKTKEKTENGKDSEYKIKKQKANTEYCIHHLYGSCRYQKNCWRKHSFLQGIQRIHKNNQMPIL